LFGGRRFCGFRPEPGRLFLQGGRFLSAMEYCVILPPYKKET